jgi:hypothetical protein
MAITDKFIVTGTAGGEAGMVNVGTGRNVTWPTSGNPSFANSGILFVGTDGGGVSAVNITTASDRGTFKPWGTGADAKPHWATGPGFVECPQAVTSRRFSMISDSEADTLNSVLTDGAGQAEIDFEGGYLFTVGFQIYTDPSTIQHTAEPTITPANAPGMQSIHEVVNAVGSPFGQLRINPTNSGGFRPGNLIANGGYVSQSEDWLASNQGAPYGHIPFNEWYPLQVWIRRSTTSGSNDGEIRWYLGKTLISRATGVNLWITTNWRLQHWASLLSGWTTARTGVQFRWCAPLKIQAVPEADLPNALIDCWQRNTALGLDLRRLWPMLAPVYPVTITTVTGTPTAPTFGRTINAGGVFPGIMELPLAGDANEEQMIELPPVWDGVTANPFGTGGWVHISLNTVFPNGGRAAYRIRNAADSANIAEVVFDDSGTGSFSINGVSTLTGRTALPEKKRWQIVLSIKAGETRVTLVNQTTDSLADTTLCRVYTSANTYVANTAIGKPQVSGRNINAMCVRAGSVSVHAEYTVTVGDSFTSAASAANTFAISGVNQGTKTFTVATMQSGASRTRRPVPGDSVLISGATGNNGWYTVASATDTTIVVVEAIPSATADGSVNLGAPEIHCLANRLAQHMPNRYDSEAIAPHYRFGHPLQDNFFDRIHPLVNLARSGGRLTELLTNILPNCLLMPNPKAVCMCFDVNDTTNTTTYTSAVSQAKTLSDNKKLLVDWFIARSGRIILLEGINGQNAGVVLNGWDARFRRVTMGQVWQNLEHRVRSEVASDTNVAMLRPPAFMPAGSITMAGDGLHPDSATALDYMAAAHFAAEASENTYGVNANDGTVQASGGRSGFGGGG